MPEIAQAILESGGLCRNSSAIIAQDSIDNTKDVRPAITVATELS